VVNGGDGTLQAVLTEILGHGAFDGRVPMIAPLRGGRTNMTALDLGTQRNSVRALADLVERCRGGRMASRILKRRILRVESGLARDIRYGMFFGGGTIHRAIQRVHANFPDGRAQGVFAGTIVTGGLLARHALGRAPGDILAPDKAQVFLDDRPVPGDRFTLLMATTVERLFAGMRPFWGHGHGGVRFTSIAEDARQFWRAIPGILAGRPGSVARESQSYTSRNAHRAELWFESGFTLDGELEGPVLGGRITLTADDVVSFVRA
jgi:hypothetical protein